MSYIECKNFINGKWVHTLDQEMIESRNPHNGDLIAISPSINPKAVNDICEDSEGVFPDWKNTPAPIRGKIIGKFGQLLQLHKKELAELITAEIGKPIKESLGEVQEAIDTCEFFQSEGRRLYGQTVPSELRSKKLYTYRRPLGVVGVISAGNFPVAVPSWKIIPALICGNTVVWKPSQDSPACSRFFMILLQSAGIPAGVVQLIYGGSAVGSALADSPYTKKISFTGSTSVGRSISTICSQTFKSLSLEMGGKNPMVVMPSANLLQAVEGAIFSAFALGGQRCTSLGNCIVHEDIYQQFRAGVMARAAKLKIGDPTDESNFYGPMISDRFTKHFDRHFEYGDTKNHLILDRRAEDHDMYRHPAIWENMSSRTDTFQKEIFGPTFNLNKVKSFEEGLTLANRTDYGLSSSLYSKDPEEQHLFIDGIEAGMTSINNSTVGAEAHLPFGGVKDSGNGTRESGIWVLDSYTYWQSVNVDNSGQLQKAQTDTDEIVENSDCLDLLDERKEE